VAVEGKLVVPHRERAVEVEFRTTLASGGPVDASWGLSFFAAAALCSADEASAPCRAGVSPPGDFGGLVDGELALVGDAGLLTIAFTDIVKRALGISLWYMGGTQAVCSVRMVGWSTCAESCQAHSPTLCVCVCVLVFVVARACHVRTGCSRMWQTTSTCKPCRAGRCRARSAWCSASSTKTATQRARPRGSFARTQRFRSGC